MKDTVYYYWTCGAGYIGQDGCLYWNLQAVFNFHPNAILGT